MRVHTRRVTHAINSDENEIQRNYDYRKVDKGKCRSIETHGCNKELSKEPDDNSNMNMNAIDQNKYNELSVNNDVEDKNKKNAEVNDWKKLISLLSIDGNSDSGIVPCDNVYWPSKK